MKREDSRTYMTDRLNSLINLISNQYKVFREDSTHYQSIKFDQCAVIEHDDGMFKVIDWSDRDHPQKMECADIIQHPHCQYVLKCQYNPKWRVPKLRPFFYFEKTKPKEFSNSLNSLRFMPKTNSKLYWRGNLHLGRVKILSEITDLLNDDYDKKIGLTSYYEELAKHKVALSLPGLGKSCHREFECFGIGTVVVSPKFQNTYHIPLIPDYHYVCVRTSIRDRLSCVTENELLSIRSNAMKFYDDYIRFENSVKWMEHLLEL
jgi:hypothetical protein